MQINKMINSDVVLIQKLHMKASTTVDTAGHRGKG